MLFCTCAWRRGHKGQEKREEERKQEEEKNTTLFMRECIEVLNRTLDESVPKCGQSIEHLLVDHGNVGGEGPDKMRLDKATTPDRQELS